VKKRRYRFAIYKGIDNNYYGCMDDKNDIVEKVDWPMEEEM
jgi:hypothetical protein